jgi:hypothetical protein
VSDIFNEVDEDVRKDKSIELWKQYGKYVVAGAVSVIAITAAVVGWQNYQKSQSQLHGSQFESAAKMAIEKKFDDAAAGFGELAKSGAEGYPALATLRQARALIEAGKGEEAIALYDQLAASDADAEFKSAAQIFAGYYLIDNGTPQQVRDRVSALTSANDIWAFSAKELLALSYLKDSKKDEAIAVFKELKDDAAAPQGVKLRATELLQVLAAE